MKKGMVKRQIWEGVETGYEKRGMKKGMEKGMVKRRIWEGVKKGYGRRGMNKGVNKHVVFHTLDHT